MYIRHIIDILLSTEDYVSGIICVYNDKICETLDNYTNGTFYELSYVIAKVYKDEEF